MSVHSAGTGAGWKTDLDVDQPHGLAYREFNDLRIGTQSRLGQEHIAFSDATKGGQHTPGGCAVLLVDSTADMATFAAAADLTSAHNFGIACNPAADPTGATLFYFSDATVTTTLPVSWNNILTDITHTFGARSEITIAPPVIFEGSISFGSAVKFASDVTIAGSLLLDSSADFSDVYVEGEFSVDGTADFGDGVAFAAEVSIAGALKVDGTASAFGAGTGIELWYDPTDYAGDSGGDSRESATLGNGLIIKSGYVATGAAAGTVTFDTAFPNGVVSVSLTLKEVVGLYRPKVTAFTVTKIDYGCENAGNDGMYWIAIGY